MATQRTTSRIEGLCCSEQVRSDPALAGLSDKDVTKRVMPFAQFRMKEALRSGKQVRAEPLPATIVVM